VQVAGLGEQVWIAEVRPRRGEPCVGQGPRGLALLVLVGFVRRDDRGAHELPAEVCVQYQPTVNRKELAHPAAPCVEAISLRRPLHANRRVQCAACHAPNGNRGQPAHSLLSGPDQRVSRSLQTRACASGSALLSPEPSPKIAHSSLRVRGSARYRSVKPFRHLPDWPGSFTALCLREVLRDAEHHSDLQALS
jgi:hypothetical protein